jgi:hypothetical protein
MDMNKIAALKRPCVVRSSSKPFNETFNIETDTLREDIIFPKEIMGLSLNLIGGKLHLRHLKYRAKGSAMKEWRKPEKTTIKKYQNSFEKTKIAVPIYFYLKDINNKPFPYYRTKDSEAQKLIKALNINPPATDDKFIFEGQCFVKHTPNKINYWHVEMFLDDINKAEITPKNKSVWARSAATEAYKHIVSGNARSVVEKYSIIPKAEYLEVA